MVNIETEKLDNHQIKITVKSDAEEFEQTKQKAARQLARRIKIPGFRPGKAPYAVILRQLGENQILDEAFELHVKDKYPQIIDEAKIEPYGPGELNDVISINPPEFTLTVPLKPVVELGEYRKLHIPYNLRAITDSDVEEVISDLRERSAIIEPSEKPASENDIVYIKLSGAPKLSESDKEQLSIAERTVPVLILPKGKRDQNEWPFPGFSRKLIKTKKGDHLNLDHTFDKDFYVDALREVTMSYSIVVEDIKIRNMPELNDEFAQTIGDDYQNVDALKNAIRKELEQHEYESYNKQYDEEVLDRIIEISNIKYPPQVFEKERENLLTQFKERLSKQNQDIDLYLKTNKLTLEQFMNELTPIAETRLKRYLVLFELAESEKIKIDPEELEKETSKTIEEINPIIQKSKITKKHEQNLFSNVMENVMMDLMVSKTMQKIKELVNATENNVIIDETITKEETSDSKDDKNINEIPESTN